LAYASENSDPALDATHLGQRLNAILRALDNLPRQARRLVRWQMKRDALLKAQKPTRISPMRPGLPPGWRERKIHEIDDVLRECHGLANDLLNAPDSS
jgi:beta-lactamase class A